MGCSPTRNGNISSKRIAFSVPVRCCHDLSPRRRRPVGMFLICRLLPGALFLFVLVSLGTFQVSAPADLSSETMKSSSLKQEQISKHAQHAVVHMGIHKTGSTTIQSLSRNLYELIKLDGFEIPTANEKRNSWPKRFLPQWRRKRRRRFNPNQADFAACFCPPTLYGLRCNSTHLVYGLDIASRNRNLFLSSEVFANIESEGVDQLALYLSPWQKTTIVVFYRRYFDWIASVYNEVTKKRKFGEKRYQWEKSVVDFIRDQVDAPDFKHTSKLVPRLRSRFDNILVLNYHDKSNGGSAKALYCHPALNMAHMCSHFDTEEKSELHSLNTGVNLDYEDLTYGAKMAGWINISSDDQIKHVAQAVQHHHESELNNRAFERICAPREILDRLWNTSLSVEKMFVQEPVNETDLRTHFNRIATTKLCKVDVNKTLSEDSWGAFFKSFT